MNDKEIGRAVRKVRGEMPQAEMAARMTARLDYAWYQNTVTKVESGERPLRMVEAIAIADELGAPLAMLAGQSSTPDVDLLGRVQRAERALVAMVAIGNDAIADPLTWQGVL